MTENWGDRIQTIQYPIGTTQDAILGIRIDSLAGFSAATPAYQAICLHFDPSKGLARVV